jgi:hypothetical protein
MNEKEEPFGAEEVREGLKRRFESAKNSYNQILNRLWTGNAAGALAAVGALGSGKIADTKLLLLALSSFLVGVFALGIGCFVSLITELLGLRDWEAADGILDVKVRYFRRPSEEAGLRVSFQNVMTLCSALTFVIGTICGLTLAVRGFW